MNNADGTRNSPSNPAKQGDFISIYGTGGGLLSPPALTGEFWGSTLSYLTLPVSVEDAAVLYAGSAPTRQSGFFQINALPTAPATSLSMTIGKSTAAVPIAITP